MTWSNQQPETYQPKYDADIVTKTAVHLPILISKAMSAELQRKYGILGFVEANVSLNMLHIVGCSPTSYDVSPKLPGHPKTDLI
jgi:hypothetical protein